MEKFIVRKPLEGSNDIDDSEYYPVGSQIEPCLFPESHKLLPYFPVSEWQPAYLDHLERRIQRNPRDLISHVRRALLYAFMAESDACYGALVDLFLILGSHGRDLRKNLLTRVQEHLSSYQYEFLSGHIDSGLTHSESMTDTQSSCLLKGLSGTAVVVMPKDHGDSNLQDPLAIARDRLAQKDFIGTQAILEGALEIDPGHEAVCIELLNLYKRHNLRNAFFNTYTAHLGRRLAVPFLWKEVERHFMELDVESK